MWFLSDLWEYGESVTASLLVCSIDSGHVWRGTNIGPRMDGSFEVSLRNYEVRDAMRLHFG